MAIKRFLLINTLALSLGASAIATAQPASEQIINMSAQPSKLHQHQSGGFLSKEQRAELQNYIEGMREEMVPLIKEKRALKLQLMGKLATPGMQWEEISKLVDKINANNNQLTTLFAKTQLQVFQKLGILLPPHRHHYHFHWQKRMG